MSGVDPPPSLNVQLSDVCIAWSTSSSSSSSSPLVRRYGSARKLSNCNLEGTESSSSPQSNSTLRKSSASELPLVDRCRFVNESPPSELSGRTSCWPDADTVRVSQREVLAVFVWQIKSRDRAPCQPSCLANSFGIVGFDSKIFNSCKYQTETQNGPLILHYWHRH